MHEVVKCCEPAGRLCGENVSFIDRYRSELRWVLWLRGETFICWGVLDSRKFMVVAMEVLTSEPSSFFSCA